MIAMAAAPSDTVRKGPPIRCAVWGTGHMGVELTRAALARGDVQPVAAIVTDPAKDGRDLGELCGLGVDLGAPASLAADAVLARDDVDVVFFCGNADSAHVADALRQTVLAGKDAVAFSGLAHPATAIGPGPARELDRVAREAGHRILGTGLAPGFLIDALPVVLASASVDWTAIKARAVMPMDDWGDMTLDAYGIGMAPGSHHPTGSRLSFLESAGIVADALGVDIARSEETFAAILADRPIERRRRVEPGASRGVRRTYCVTTSAGRTITIEMVAVYGFDEAFDDLREQYVVEVEGKNPGSGVRAELSGGWSPDPYPATAACGLNALPGLLSLSPGLYTVAHVPFAVPRGDWPSAAVTG
jgi:2,4-diaminopentanoate dehydrogenase